MGSAAEPAPDATQGATARWVRPRIEAAGPLQPGEAKVARVLLEDPDTVIYQSASEFAEGAGTSTATVVRFAQKLGFKGFHELKLKLAQDQAVFQREQVEYADRGEAGSVLARVTSVGAQSVADAAALVSPQAFDRAAALLGGARRVLFAGVGTSFPLVQDAAYRFRTIGIDTDASPDVHVQHVAARLLRAGDACLAISHTGSTRETLMVVEAAKSAGAATIAVTSFLRSPLTEIADVVLTSGSREVSFRLEAMASRLAHMAVVDALLVAVAEHDEDRARRALDLFADVLGEHRI